MVSTRLSLCFKLMVLLLLLLLPPTKTMWFKLFCQIPKQIHWEVGTTPRAEVTQTLHWLDICTPLSTVGSSTTKMAQVRRHPSWLRLFHWSIRHVCHKTNRRWVLPIQPCMLGVIVRTYFMTLPKAKTIAVPVVGQAALLSVVRKMDSKLSKDGIQWQGWEVLMWAIWLRRGLPFLEWVDGLMVVERLIQEIQRVPGYRCVHTFMYVMWRHGLEYRLFIPLV